MKSEDGTLIVELPLEISNGNAADVEQELADIFLQNDAAERIVLDAGRTRYITSAGLRVILKLVKMDKPVSVINASPSVYEVFEVSGFINLIPVQKPANGGTIF